jgi:phage tail P2-like protein
MAEPLPLPPGINDTRFQALAAIASDHLGRITDALPKLLVYRLDDVDASLLPHLAWQFHVMGVEGWDIAADDAARRALVRSAFELHRYKGTPWAVKKAASAAIGLTIAVEEEPGDARWAAYQIDPGRVLTREEAARLVVTAGAWGPARAKLRRVYHGYDLRPIVASGSVALDEGLLDDDSGVDLDGVRQSFGQFHGAAVASGTPDHMPSGGSSRWGGSVVYTDRPVLDHWAFGDDVVFNHPITTSELTTLATSGLPLFMGMIGTPLSIPRAALVASESVLGEVNAILGAWGIVEEGEQLVASGTAKLSDYRLTAASVRFEEVFAETVGCRLVVEPNHTPTLSGMATHRSVAAPVPLDTVLDGEAPERVNHPAAGLGAAGGIGGPYEAPWPSAPWSDQPWGAVVGTVCREETIAATALVGLAFVEQGLSGQTQDVCLFADLGARASLGIWSGAVIAPDELAFWSITPWPDSPFADRIPAGGGGFGGWFAQLSRIPKVSLSAGPYEPMWPDVAWSVHGWSDPVVTMAVTTTGA